MLGFTIYCKIIEIEEDGTILQVLPNLFPIRLYSTVRESHKVKEKSQGEQKKQKRKEFHSNNM